MKKILIPLSFFLLTLVLIPTIKAEPVYIGEGITYSPKGMTAQTRDLSKGSYTSPVFKNITQLTITQVSKDVFSRSILLSYQTNLTVICRSTGISATMLGLVSSGAPWVFNQLTLTLNGENKLQCLIKERKALSNGGYVYNTITLDWDLGISCVDQENTTNAVKYSTIKPVILSQKVTSNITHYICEIPLLIKVSANVLGVGQIKPSSYQNQSPLIMIDGYETLNIVLIIAVVGIVIFIIIKRQVQFDLDSFF
jgi:hypothetical protein